MIYRLLITIVALASLYFIYDIARAYSLRNNLYNAGPGFYIGADDPDVTIVKFFDYSCAGCRSSHPVFMDYFKSLPEDGPKVRYIPRPVYSTNNSGILAGRMAYAASMQGKFIEAHEWLMRNPLPIDESAAVQMARELALDYNKLRVDMDNPNVEMLLKTNGDVNLRIGSASVPTFYVEGLTWVVGPRTVSVQDFENIVNEAMQ
ncbi:MAG: hypothetical protein CBB87_01755 [Micavibrio sp. TMED27]|nr:hypothetical protein [Micavibrio sp.]OUT92489.1 MAG: hypothetical protein CBB87_01755 [Micavibrio sp. TMED27]|tara:strand:- start:1572 stop:2183 length:612 start_codon:yes stop_codon:yes gene_type:complete